MRRPLLVLLILCLWIRPVSAQGARTDTTSYVRLIFIAKCFTAAENSAFRYAAANLVADYARDTLSRQIIKRIYFDNARQIVDSINSQRLVIRSVDFLSHSRTDRIGAIATRGGIQYRTSLFESRQRMEEARVLADAEGGDLHNGSRMAYIEEIDFSRFSYDAVIEIHGCHGGTEVDSLPGGICRRLSLALYMSGKQLAVAIGHVTRANPNLRTGGRFSAEPAGARPGDGHAGAAAVSGHPAGGRPGIGHTATAAVSASTGFRESVLAQDYRHGLRMIYFNGRTILATRQTGAVPRAEVISAIVEAQNAGAR